jgi:hypothetical protein
MSERPAVIIDPLEAVAAIIVLQCLVRRLYGDIIAEFGLDREAVGQLKEQMLAEQLQDLAVFNPNPAARDILAPYIRQVYDTIFDGMGAAGPSPSNKRLALVGKPQ